MYNKIKVLNNRIKLFIKLLINYNLEVNHEKMV